MGGYVIPSCDITFLLSIIIFQGYPDVAAQSENFRFLTSGKRGLASGTSASTPTFAGIVALLNDVRLSKKQPPLGFLNPLLYSKGVSSFNDITVGHNSGCGTTGFNVRLPSLLKVRKLITLNS
jgi:subtilase family serine protease